MAGLSQNRDNCKHYAQSFKHIFKPQETPQHPCDVTLVVNGGKAEFQAHGDVLSEASPFFQKMLSSDMKESNEGVVRLEMFSEAVMTLTMEFIYTGSAQISTLEIAEGLIVVADYLFLTKLKTLAEGVAVSLQTLNMSNCISSYNFAERYQCEELLSKARQFILSNFTTVAKIEEFMNMTSKQIEMWISSDEIDVSAEEDVFKIILRWINRDKSKRKKHFAELFRHVRLVYVTRDYLCNDVVTNELVRDSEGCLDVVKDAMKLIDSKSYKNLSARPRKCLETAVIVCFVEEHIVGYYPRQDKVCRIGENSFSRAFSICDPRSKLVPCQGKLYCICPSLQKLICYDPFSNICSLLPYPKGRNLRQIFAGNEDEMFALVSEFTENHPNDVPPYIAKYRPESNTWKDISSLKFAMVSLSSQEGMCILVRDSFIYFIGGRRVRNHWRRPVLKNVYRYDLVKKQGNRLANLQLERAFACGASAHGKIFVTGGIDRSEVISNTCEVYDETTNEWQFIASLCTPPDTVPRILSVDDALYSVARFYGNDSLGAEIERYESDEDKWYKSAEIPMRVNAAEARTYHICDCSDRVNASSMRIFKGFLSECNVQKKALASLVVSRDKAKTPRGRRCLIL